MMDLNKLTRLVFIKLKILAILCFICNMSFANNIFIPFSGLEQEFNIKLSIFDESIFNKIKKDLSQKMFVDAFIKSLEIKDKFNREIIQTIITAEGFKEIDVLNYKNFINLIKFNTENSYLPFFEKFHSKIEKYYINNSNVKYDDVKDYFKQFKPQKASVYLKLLKQEDDYIFENYAGKDLEIEKDKLDKKIIKIWLESDFSEEENISFYNGYKFIIEEKNLIKKMEELSFGNDKKKLKSLLKVLKDNNYKTLFEMIIKIDNNPKNINQILKNIPKYLKNEEILKYAKAKYYRKNEEDKEVLKILYSLKDTETKYPEKWWLYRHIYIRNLIKEKEYKKAYYVAANHGKLDRNNTYDAEWLSGWIALRFLNRPYVALEHFNYIYNNCSYPISLSKASYWLGKTYQTIDDNKKAKYWYTKSANFPLTFYGQISTKMLFDLNESGNKYELKIPEMPEFKEKNIANENKTIRFAYFYYKYLNEKERGFELFKKAINNAKSDDEIIYIINLVGTLENYNHLISLAKVANYKQVYFIDYLFPVIRLVNFENIDMPFVHSIIKQESNFIINAISSVGATGLMQIMPSTAKLLCRDLKITYNHYKLKNDMQYNMKLGSYYLNRMMKEYNGSKTLTIASYNAGQGNVKKWIKGYGDPREMKDIDDIIDWIECIPFGETRNYVMRVLENIIVYNIILKKHYNLPQYTSSHIND